MKKLIIYLLVATVLAMAVFAVESTTPSDYIYGYDDFDSSINTSFWNDGTTGFSWDANFGRGVNWSNGGGRADGLGTRSMVHQLSANSNSTWCIKFYDDLNMSSFRLRVTDNYPAVSGLDSTVGNTNNMSYVYSDGAATYSTGVTRTQGWHEICISVQPSYVGFYIDSRNTHNQSAYVAAVAHVVIWDFSAAVHIDVMRGWNGTFNKMPQGGTPGGSPQPAVFISPTPVNGATNNTNVTINVACNGSVYLWFGNTTSDSFLVLRNSSATKTYTTGINISSTWNYMANCWNSTAPGGFGVNTTSQNWTYDVVTPVLTLGATNFFTAGGKSTVNSYNKSLLVPLNFTLEDGHLLYAYEINISKNGMTWYYELNQTLGSVKIYNLTKTINITNLTTGSYNISLTVADTHTQKEIKDYDVTKSNKKLEFKTTEGNNIVIETPDDSTTNAKKLKDRYTFEFNFTDNIEGSRTFSIKANNPIFYYPESGYDAHFVVGNGVHGNWVDFVGSGSTYIVTKINDKRYDITFDDLMPQIVFHSIGGLNEYAYNGTWFRGEYFYTNTNSWTGEANQFQLNVTVDNTIQNVTTAFYYNNTLVSSVRHQYGGSYFFDANITAPNASGLYPILWFMNYTQVSDPASYQFNITDNNTVLTFGISECNQSINVTVLNITIREENIPSTPLNATLQIDSIVWITAKSNSRNFTTRLSGSANYTICMYSNITLKSDLYILTNASGGLTHRYYEFNRTLVNNNTYNLALYNFGNATGLSTLKITTKDQDTFDPKSNIVAKLQRRYVDEGIWRVVQMGLSDTFGVSGYDIIERDVDYQLSFYDTDNNLLYTDARQSFICIDPLNPTVCTITYLLGDYIASSSSPELNVVMYYNNVTHIIQVNWSDSLALTSSLRVVASKRMGVRDLTICNTMQAGSAGTINCNITGYEGDIYVEVFSTASPEVPSLTRIIHVAQSTLQNYLSSRTESVALTLLISTPLILAGATLHPIGALIGLVVSVIFTSWFGLIGVIGGLFIIILAVVAVIVAIRVRQ